MSLPWSEFQLRIFHAIEHTDASYIVEAVAGSGKTTTIVEAINHVDPNKSVTFLAFNKSIADELKRRITAPNAKCMTLHALGFTAWREHIVWDAQGLKVDSKKTHQIVDELELAWGDWTKEMTKLVGLAKGAGLVPLELQEKYPGGLTTDAPDVWEAIMEHFDIDEDEVDLELVKKVLRISIEKSHEVIDFDDMLYMPIIAGAAFQKSDVVFLDEAQDVNGIQMEIVDRMRHATTRVIAVGDPHQAIYGFRGAMSDSLDRIAHQFECKMLPLSVSYRCPKAVVRHTRRLVHHIQASETAQEGSVDYCWSWDVRKFLPGDAILCRNSRPVVAMAFQLIRNKIAARVVGRDIGQGLIALVKKMKANSLVDLTERLKKYRDREVLRAKGNEQKISALDDKIETIEVFMEECGPNAGILTLLGKIEQMFGESAEMRGMVMCSTVHKAKGLEWERVFVLDADLYMPSKWAILPWEREQEINLMYVAETRAKRELRYISTEGVGLYGDGVQVPAATRAASAGGPGPIEREFNEEREE